MNNAGVLHNAHRRISVLITGFSSQGVKMYKLICLSLVALCFLALACQQQVKEVDAAQQMATEVLNRYLEIFNTGNMALVDATISESHFLVEPEFPDRIVGRKGFTDWVNVYRTAYSDFNLVFNEIITKDNSVVVRWTVTGTNDGMLRELPPTGKKVRVTGMSLIRIVNGKIAEEWIYYDNLGSSEQLGATLMWPEA